MNLFNQLQLVGPLVWMLLSLSIVSLALILERLAVHIVYPAFSRSRFEGFLKACQTGALENSSNSEPRERHGWRSGVSFLYSKRQLRAERRQHLALDWLLREKRYLSSRLKLLGLMAAIAPLLGLLGTVFGIIEMFKAIAASSAPVTPALLADGLWAAMLTTAIGLMIAIPSMLAAHGFELLAQWRLTPVQDALNEVEAVFQTGDDFESGRGGSPLTSLAEVA